MDSDSAFITPNQAAEHHLTTLIRHLGYRPLVVLTVALVLGVLAAEHLCLSFSLALLVPLVLACAAFLLARSRSAFSHLWLAAAFFLAGMNLHAAQSAVSPHDISRFAPADQAAVVGRVVDIREQHPYWRRLVLAPELVTVKGQHWPATGLVSLAESDWQQKLAVGERVSVEVVDFSLPPPAMNLGQFDMRRYLARQGVTASARVKSLQVLPGPMSWRFKLKNSVRLSRQRALRNLERAMPGANAAFYAHLMAGMVYGMHAATGIDKPTEDLFRRTGTIHLLVVSGAQVTFIIFTLILLVTAGRRRALHPWHALVIAPVVVAFALLAGPAPSVSRSLIMAGLFIYALVTGQRYDVPTGLALAVFVLVVADTSTVFNIGAQLTFAAVIGVILYSPRRYRDALGVVHRPRLIAIVLLATLGAWIMVTPILARNFYGFAGLANLANAIAVPISMLVVPLGIIALVTGSVLGPVTMALCGLTRILMQIMLWSNELFARLPFAYVDNVYFSWPVITAWYLGLGGLILVLLKPDLRRRAGELARGVDRRWAVVGLAAAIALAMLLVVVNDREQRLRVTFLAVGEGQCAVIEAPGGQVMMVDAGSRQYPGLRGEMLADRVILPFLAQRGIRRLDALVITHPQSDHCNAVPRLVERMPVSLIIEPGFDPDTQVWREVESAITEHHVPVQVARAGGVVALGGGVEALVLAPSRPLITGSRDDLNNNSIALRLEYGEVSLLMLADQEKAGLQRLVTWSRQRDISLSATIMQVPHHGRSLRYAGPIIGVSQPRLGIISGGEAFDLASASALPSSVEVAITGEVGMITVETDGDRVKVCRFLSGCRLMDW